MMNFVNKIAIINLLATFICIQAVSQDTITTLSNRIYVGYIFKKDSLTVSYRNSLNEKNNYNQISLSKVKSIRWSVKALEALKLDSASKVENKSSGKEFAKDTIQMIKKMANNALNESDLIKNTFLTQEFKNDKAKNDFTEGLNDSKKFYNAHKPGNIVFLGSTLAAPLMFIPMLIMSEVTPNSINCITDDYSKFEDKNYTAGYKNGALKIKRKAIWKKFGEGLTFNVAIIGLVFIILNRTP